MENYDFLKLRISLTKDALSYEWLKLVQWYWRRWKCEKFTDRWMKDDRQSEKLTWAFNSGELKWKQTSMHMSTLESSELKKVINVFHLLYSRNVDTIYTNYMYLFRIGLWFLPPGLRSFSEQGPWSLLSLPIYNIIQKMINWQTYEKMKYFLTCLHFYDFAAILTHSSFCKQQDALFMTSCRYEDCNYMYIAEKINND